MSKAGARRWAVIKYRHGLGQQTLSGCKAETGRAEDIQRTDVVLDARDMLWPLRRSDVSAGIWCVSQAFNLKSFQDVVGIDARHRCGRERQTERTIERKKRGRQSKKRRGRAPSP